MALLAGCAADFPFRGEVASVSLQIEPNRNTFVIFPSLPPPRPPPTPLQWPRLIQNKRSPTEKESRAWKILLDVNCKKENQFCQYMHLLCTTHAFAHPKNTENMLPHSPIKRLCWKMHAFLRGQMYMHAQKAEQFCAHLQMCGICGSTPKTVPIYQRAISLCAAPRLQRWILLDNRWQ